LSAQDRALAESVKDNIITFAIYIGERSFLLSPLQKRLAQKPQMPQVSNYSRQAVHEVIVLDGSDSDSDEPDDVMIVDPPPGPATPNSSTGGISSASSSAAQPQPFPSTPTAPTSAQVAPPHSQPSTSSQTSAVTSANATAPAKLARGDGRWTPFSNRVRDDTDGDVEMVDAIPLRKSRPPAHFRIKTPSRGMWTTGPKRPMGKHRPGGSGTPKRLNTPSSAVQ